MPLKICILEADDLHPQLEPDFHSFGSMFVQLLGRQEQPAEFSVYNVVRGDYPCETEHFDAFLVTGSKADAFGEDAWIVQLRRYLLLRYQSGDVLLGVCFGHQILALVLGGKTERAVQGWGAGVHSYRMQVASLANQACPPVIRMLISHRDQVTRLPEGAQLLASSEFCPNAAFMLDGRVLCFQGHPEFTAEFSRSLLQLRQGIYTGEFYAKSLDSLQQSHDGDTVGSWMLDFVAATREQRTTAEQAQAVVTTA